MPSRLKETILATTAAIVLAVLWPAVTTTAGQAKPAAPPQAAPYRAPRTADGKPNLNGIWQALNSANWDIQGHAAQPSPFPELLGALGAVPPGQGVVEGNEIPYQPWALAKKKENFEKRLAPESFADVYNRNGGDPEARCYLPGVPRATYMPFPFQIIQGDRQILVASPFASASRIIHMTDVGESPADAWMGWSRAKWDGDTLVVNVTNQIEDTWFDRAGNFHSEQLNVVERYTPAGDNVIQYEATMTDPKVFTRPWKVSLPLYRRIEKNAQFLEFKCVPFSEDLIYGHLRKK